MLVLLAVNFTVVLLAASYAHVVTQTPLMATVRARSQSATSGNGFEQNLGIHRATGRRVSDAGSAREARFRGRDPLRDHRAIVGRDARTSGFVRFRSLILLLLLVIALGAAIAGITLTIIASGRFLLEILAS